MADLMTAATFKLETEGYSDKLYYTTMKRRKKYYEGVVTIVKPTHGGLFQVFEETPIGDMVEGEEEGNNYPTDVMKELPAKVFTVKLYKRAVLFGELVIRRQNYGFVNKGTAGLAIACVRSMNICAAVPFNQAFNTAYPPIGETGVGLCGTHTLQKSLGTQINKGTSSLSPDALLETQVALGLQVDHSGKLIDATDGLVLIHPRTLGPKVKEILGSDKKAWITDNTKNVIEGITPKENPYFDPVSTKNWGLMAPSICDILFIVEFNPEFGSGTLPATQGGLSMEHWARWSGTSGITTPFGIFMHQVA